MTNAKISKVQYSLILLLFAYITIIVSACVHEDRPFTLKRPDYNPIPLNVAMISVVNEDMGSDSNVDKLPFSPRKELMDYLNSKFKAIGSSGELKIHIYRANVDLVETSPQDDKKYRATYSIVMRFKDPKMSPTMTEMKFNVSSESSFTRGSLPRERMKELAKQTEDLLQALQLDIDARMPVSSNISPYIYS